ncbi:period circadian protein homolog 2-like isoform X3 [Ruditapes philippinarum]|uniref:period circadian protein homolog 2-like isoform X3 n=1 Tax=Ruditapes philippinarum TaxID=129788 RepID=UPI00295B15E5|nr:period circadian protein homolog 2-like isoform X3 [Ruditapes philippinarum]
MEENVKKPVENVNEQDVQPKHVGSNWKPRTGQIEDKRESSSTSSFFSGSNFTMSCSGVDTQEENEPSTSGCSSFLAHTEKERSKAKKKERVKEYLKELKSIVQAKGEGRVGTLSTLQHVLSSMRKIKDAKEKSRTQKKVLPDLGEDQYMGPPADLSHTVYESDSHESLTCESLKSSDELRVIISSSDHIVRAVSANMKYVLGYPKESWIGRSFDDYVHKKDLITFVSFHRTPDDGTEVSDSEVTGESKIFYFRLRKFKSLGSSGFSLRKQDYYTPFQCTFTRKKMTTSEVARMGTYPSWYESTSTSVNSGSPDAIQMTSESSSVGSQGEKKCTEEKKLYTIMYCVPLMSPYSESGLLPEVKTFETRQTLFCSFCHIQPNTIPLLGYLPQEMIGVSIFEFFHNDDLSRLFNIYTKVIALKGVPYKSGPIRFLAKNGSWISCVTEWSSFVNPWSKRLEFIIGKHTVVKGPDNTDVFSENFHHTSRIEEDSEAIRLARQKIKDLLLQPVETVYIGNNGDKTAAKSGGKSVAIVEEKESTDTEQVIPQNEHKTIYASEREKSAMHGTGVLFKENSISRAYDQLNYTNCIKKFLLSQPRSFSSDSDPKKSSSEDGFDEEMNSNVLSDSDFDFDISVPKPPSFGSSTKVLVSEQEHRDNETLLDPMVLRDQLQLPSTFVDSTTPLSPVITAQSTRDTPVTTDRPEIMTLTRESLWKHTILQEQLYIATASPDRNILFVNEGREMEYPGGKRQRHSLKRSHSPDHTSIDRCKTGRHSMESQPVSVTQSIMNPVFPLLTYKTVFTGPRPNKYSTSSDRMMVPMQMYPIVSIQSDDHVNASHIDSQSSLPSSAFPCSYDQITGMTFKPRVMVGFHQTSTGQSRMPLGMPIPVHQLNSYVMQQANSMVPKSVSTRPSRLKQEKAKSQLQSSSESSSTEDTSSTFYLLESSENKMKSNPMLQAYNQLVMQSLAQQMNPTKGLDPAPWLQNLCFTDGLQNRYHMYRAKHKRQLKKDREDMEKITQPDLLMSQFEELLLNTEHSPGFIRDQEYDCLAFDDEVSQSVMCSCVRDTCCKNFPEDHGISDALKRLRKHSKKKEKRIKKPSQQSILQNAAVQTEEDMCKMEVDSDTGVSVQPQIEVQETDTLENINESKSCSSKSDSGEADIRCDMSSSSINSLNSSDVTPSDQRSNNENGSSLKESDGDAMSKKSDSSSSDKQLLSSESESESKNKCSEDIFDRLFASLDICFPHLHKDNVPWLLDVEFNEEVEMNYTIEPKDKESVLRSDLTQLEYLDEPDMVRAQLNALMEELGQGNLELVSIMSNGETNMDQSEPALVESVDGMNVNN